MTKIQCQNANLSLVPVKTSWTAFFRRRHDRKSSNKAENCFGLKVTAVRVFKVSFWSPNRKGRLILGVNVLGIRSQSGIEKIYGCTPIFFEETRFVVHIVRVIARASVKARSYALDSRRKHCGNYSFAQTCGR